MLGRRSREAPAQASTGPAGFAAKADDLESLRGAVVDAASVGAGLWLSYLFALFYFAVAAGAVTHRDLLLEDPVKLPFLNVELPLTAFFILGPLVFVIVHGYVLLHFVMLAGKTGAFDKALSQQVADDNRRTRLRRQLPSNAFVQFLAGPREVRHGVVGFLLKAVAWISLVFAPIALLVLFQLQFLPYHDPIITWWHRIAVAIDLVLLWLLWPPILRGEARLLTWRDFGRGWVLVGFAASLVPLFLVFTIATFPGEWLNREKLNERLRSVAWVPTKWPVWQSAPAEGSQAEAAPTLGANQAGPRPAAGSTSSAQVPTISLSAINAWHLVRQNVTNAWHSIRQNTIYAWNSMGWTSPYGLLVAGEPDRVRQEPGSVWSNVLVLPNLDLSDRAKLSFRGRHLERAIFVAAIMKRADFTGADLPDADLTIADLSQAKFNCDQEDKDKTKCSNLQGASLLGAQLQGAELTDAQLQGAFLPGAKLQGALLNRAQLQGADLLAAQLQGAELAAAQLQGAELTDAQLQGAELTDAQLQGALLNWAQLQGASLKGAELQNAFLAHVFIWRMVPSVPALVEHAQIVSPVPDAKYPDDRCEGKCEWSRESYETLKAKIEAVPSGVRRELALKRIKPLGEEPFTVDEKAAEKWLALAEASKATAESYPARLAQTFIKTGCDEPGAPYVIRGLLRLFDEPIESSVVASQKAAVARAFLEADCEGARGLSDDDKARLHRLAGPAQSRVGGAPRRRR